MTPHFPFAPGNTVYSIGGHKATYVSSIKGGHIVRPLYDTCCGGGDEVDCHEEEGDLTEWDTVYAKPPVEKLHAEVAALDAQLAAKRAELDEERKVQRELDEAMRARKDRIAQHEHLKRLDDYVSGRITHYVAYETGYSNHVGILSVDEAKDEDYHREFGLLTIQASRGWYGDRKIEWHLNRKGKDGYSKDEKVIPCCSHQEAIDRVTVIYETLLKEWREAVKDTARHYSRSTDKVRQAAKVIGVAVPDDVLAHDRATEEAAAQKALVEAQKQLAAAQARVNGVPRDPSQPPYAPPFES